MHVPVESVSTGLKAPYNIYSFKITYDISITVPFLQLNKPQYTLVKVPVVDPDVHFYRCSNDKLRLELCTQR